jgi:hypothetical protein
LILKHGPKTIGEQILNRLDGQGDLIINERAEHSTREIRNFFLALKAKHFRPRLG